MESRELRYFITVAEEGTFTRAAARLFMTQPALSRAVKQIERDLGAALFHRTHKGATLTDVGRVLLREGRTALEVLDRAESRTRAARDDGRPGSSPPPGPPVPEGPQPQAPDLRVPRLHPLTAAAHDADVPVPARLAPHPDLPRRAAS